MAERKFPDWATVFNPDIGNGDPNVEDPGQAKQDSGWIVEKPLVQYMNWLQNLQGHFIKANNQFKVEADMYEAEAGEIILMDNSSASVTGLLPDTPLDGQWVVFGGVTDFVTNGVAINGNGNDIMIVADDEVDLDINDSMFLFYWDETNSLWKINIWGTQGR